jgi:deoxyribose-phosphate aldolase
MRAVTRIALFLGHTLLAPEPTAPDIQQLREEAARHRMGAVCVYGH